MKDSGSPEYIEATPASRRKLGAILAIGVLGGMALLEFVLPEYLAFMRALPFCEQLDWVEATMLVLLAAFALPAPWCWIAARKVLTLGQWPLPGAPVWQRTRVDRGAKVLWRGRVMKAAAVAMLVVPLGMAYYVHDWLGEARTNRCQAVRPRGGTRRKGSCAMLKSAAFSEP